MTREKAYEILDKLPRCTECDGTFPYNCDECDEAFLTAFDALKQPEWIPVSERLPENAKHPKSFCPRYQVMTKWGVTEGWYNPDIGGWYMLLWFFDSGRIDFKCGTTPKVFNEVDGAKVVTHWREFPEPPKDGEQE